MKKGAMFGLDARIALAIFGALSVISGAALYSAITAANTEKYRQMFNEIVKASEAFYLDEGSKIPQHLTSVNALTGSVLVQNTNSSPNWKGPYFPGTYYDDTSIIAGPEKSLASGARLNIFIMQNSTWSANNTYQTCSSIGDLDCSEWVQLYGGNTAEGRQSLVQLFPKLDNLVDSGDGALAGTIRAIDFTGNDYRIYYRGIPHVRTQ